MNRIPGGGDTSVWAYFVECEWFALDVQKPVGMYFPLEAGKTKPSMLIVTITIIILATNYKEGACLSVNKRSLEMPCGHAGVETVISSCGVLFVAQ